MIGRQQILIDLQAYLARTMAGHMKGTEVTQAQIKKAESSLETAKPGDKLLLATFGEGADAILFTVTENIEKLPKRKAVSGHLDSKSESMTYEKYLNWRNR